MAAAMKIPGDKAFEILRVNVRTHLILFGILVASAASAEDWFKRAEKIEGNPAGFFSSRAPTACWQANTEHRLTGPVSALCTWSNIQSVHIVLSMFHIRGGSDVEHYVKAVFADTTFLKAVPERVPFSTEERDRNLSLQALVKLKDGTYALLSMSDRWAVIEHNGKFGLIMWERLKP